MPWRGALIATIGILLLGAFSSLAVPTAHADPTTTDNGDGTSTAVWNFTTPTDYALANTEISGATAALERYAAPWNSTTAADFAAPDNVTNVDLARWPGNVTLAATSGPSTLLSLQPAPAVGEDTWLDQQNVNMNHGSDTTLILDGFNPQSRPILRFDLSSIPAGAVIDGATLNLYQSAGVGATFTGYAVQVTSSWNEAQATWNNRMTGTPWGTAGGDINIHVIGQVSLDNTAGWRSWNVTQLVDLWYRGRLPNNGLMLAAISTGANADKTFFSSDYAVDSTRRPRLDLSYRILGATGVYVSKVGGPGTMAQWQSISWNASARSLVADEFNGGSLDPKWTWINPPAAQDVGATTPGHLHVVSTTGVDIGGATFTGNVLWERIVGDFNATMKFSTNPTAGGQKAGLMALLDTWNWYGVQKRYDSASGTVRWQIRATADAATTTRVDVANANPIPAWSRLVRAGNTFQAWTSDNGIAWLLRDTYSPTDEYPYAIRLAFFAADGTSGVPLAVDVDYIRVSQGPDATTSVSTRTGNVTPVDATWTNWSAPYGNPAGSGLSGSSRYLEFRLSFAVTSPDHAPVVGDVNVSWTARMTVGTVETRDLVTSDISKWRNVSVVQALNGQSIAYEYSLDGGGSWRSVSPPASLLTESVATGRIRFRATLTTTDPTVTPTLSEIRLTFLGARPWIGISAPASNAHVTGIVPIQYANSSGAVRVTFEYNDGSGWMPIGSPVLPNGTFLWNTSGLNFVGGSLRATVENNRTITNTTLVSPIEVDNTAPTITLGTVSDDQATNGTLTFSYVTDPDVVRVDFTYFNGTWNSIGSDTSVDGTFTWTPSGPIENVTVRAVAIDEVGLRGTTDKVGVGRILPAVNPPTNPPPGIWQTPYVLAIPPLGVLVMIGMFAQRQRWRPAKAFLVDERGKMLREFTLDPACQVTYGQVVEAGILDAVDKPIKIQKYHGQTVRGDALAVALLAYGPVSPEQVEFAREMLVQVQDKFEDAIKQRLEEARQEEGRLEARSKELDERGVGIEARGVELDAIQKQANEARSQIESDRTAVASKEEDLRRREVGVAQERVAVEDLAKKNEAARAELDAGMAQVEAREAELSTKSQAIAERETSVRTVEERLNERQRDLAPEEDRLRAEKERLAQETEAIRGERKDVDDRGAVVRKDLEDLARGREQFEIDQKDLLQFKRSVDERVASAEAAEAAAAAKTEELNAREARLAPLEAELEAREARAREAEERAGQATARAEATHQELSARTRDLEDRETALNEDRVVLQEARAAFDSDRREFQDRTAHYEEELRRRGNDLDAQAKEIGEGQLRIAQDKEAFDAARTEKNQGLLAREIEVEAREQSVQDKEDAVRAQAEENARRLTDLAAREETLEIENEKLAKGRAEVESRNANLTNLAQELDGKAAGLRETEAKRAEELRTWQTTLESQQAMLKEQRETFEQESSSQRESWAVRIMRLERREIEVKDQEEKIRQDDERFTRTEEELGRREKAVEEASQSATLRKAEADHLKGELEQRALEIDSKERAFKEESARHALELSTRTEALNVLEADMTAKRTELERERTSQTQRFHEIDGELQRNAQTLEARARDFSDRERRIVASEESLRSNESRLEQERAAVQETGRQLEAYQLELAQLKDRYETESARVRTEAEAIGQSLAIKEAELRAERDRIERDATTLQDTLGAKAKELAIREKAVAAQEADLRADVEDLETRTRELETKENQAEAKLTELSAQAMALVRREQDLNSRDTQIDEAVKKFHTEEMEKRKQWENQQTTLRSAQAQLNATSESRTGELTKRSEEIEGRERAVRAGTTQLDLERSKLEAQAKAHAARAAEAEASWKRSEGRLVELKAKEDELLRMRQSFESERSGWSTKRAEELKQLEATRDATAVQAQQAERLIADSQRRALVAEEAERSAKRQSNDLATQQAALERRRSEADKAERTAQAQLIQLQEKTRELAAKEAEVQAASRDLEARLARLAVAEKETAQASADARTRKGSLDQETTRLGNLSEQLAARQKGLEGQSEDLESKLEEMAAKERTVETELQRANNLMEDLGKKDRDLRARTEQAAALQSELVTREADLAARDALLSEGLRNLEKSRHEAELARDRIDDDLRSASAARSDAERLRIQADAMQAEVSKNLRFLQKKALEVLDREEKLRERDVRVEEKEKGLDARAEILEGKERSLESDQSESDARAAKLQAEVDKLKARFAEIEKGAGPSSASMDEWKKDVENRVKIIQKKAMELLDREQKLREKEEELRALAQQLGVTL